MRTIIVAVLLSAALSAFAAPPVQDPGDGGGCRVCELQADGWRYWCRTYPNAGSLLEGWTTGREICIAHNSVIGPNSCEMSGAYCHALFDPRFSAVRKREQIMVARGYGTLRGVEVTP